jgi:hypothetical protein
MSTKSFLLLLASLPLAACVSTTPHWDSQFGQSVRTAVASQTLHPAAGARRDPVTGLDGQAALGAQQRYEHSFAQPEPAPPSILINTAGK